MRSAISASRASAVAIIATGCAGRGGHAERKARLAAARAAGDERQRHGRSGTPERACPRGDDRDVALAVVHHPHARVVVLGDRVLAQHLRRRAGRDGATRRQEQHAVGVLPGQGEVVHRRDHRQPAGVLLGGDELEHVLLVADVECARRLVEQQQLRALRERAGEHGALQLAARERGQRAPGELHQVEALEHLGDDRVIARALAAERAGVRRATEQDVVGDGREVRHDGRLRHQRDAARELAAIEPRDVVAEHRDAPARAQEARDGEQRRALAGAVRPDQGEPRAALDAQREVVHDLDPAAPDADVLELDGAHDPGRAHAIPRAERRTMAKKGAPRNAVMTPIGSSAAPRSCARRGRRARGTPRRARATAAAARACCRS